MNPVRYIKRLLLGVDQLGNTILGGAPDETISAHAGRLKCKPTWSSRLWWTPLARVLNVIQKDHVEHAVESEETGSQQDPAYAEVYDPDDKVVVVLKDSECK